MPETTCPRCGTAAAGKFCPECGAALAPNACPSCGATLPPGARFCTACGKRVGLGGLPAWLPWSVAAAAGASLVVVLLVLLFQDDTPPPARTTLAGPGAGAPFASGQTGAPPPLSGDMRTNADQLFDRVMRSASAGDSADALRFAPMAIQAYEAAGATDADGLYHVSLLRTLSGDPEGGLETARQVLERDPNHLLALAAGAEAALAADAPSEARTLYSRLLDAWEEEQSRGLAEYQAHESILQEYRSAARSFLED